jgi:hypothetical protein
MGRIGVIWGNWGKYGENTRCLKFGEFRGERGHFSPDFPVSPRMSPIFPRKHRKSTVVSYIYQKEIAPISVPGFELGTSAHYTIA